MIAELRIGKCVDSRLPGSAARQSNADRPAYTITFLFMSQRIKSRAEIKSQRAPKCPTAGLKPAHPQSAGTCRVFSPEALPSFRADGHLQPSSRPEYVSFYARLLPCSTPKHNRLRYMIHPPTNSIET